MHDQPKPSSLINDIFMAVILTSFLTLLIIAYSSIIFIGPYNQYAPIGYFAMFFGVIIVNLAYSRYANLPFLIAGPDSVISIFFGLLMAPLLQSIGPSQSFLMTIITTFVLTNLLTATSFYVIGKFQLGQIIRFIPYTVIGGFLTGLSFLLIKRSFSILTDQALIDVMIHGTSKGLIACTLLTTTLIFFIRAKIKNNNATSIFLLLTVLLFNMLVSTLFKNTDMTSYFLQTPGVGMDLSFSSINWAAVSLIDFDAIFKNLHFILGLSILSVFIHLLNNSSIEMFSGQNDDLDKQIQLTSKANFMSALFAAYITIPNVGVSLLAFNMKGNYRLALLLTSLFSIIVMIFLQYLIPFVPKFIIASVLLMVSVNLMKRWLIDSWKMLDIFDYGSIILISILIVQTGLAYGIIAGLLINSIFFIINSSHTKTMRYHVTDSQYQSNFIRPQDQIKYLETAGTRIHLYKLQGYLFFGSAKKLADSILSLFIGKVELDYIILDFSLVTGIDVSGCYCFVRLEQEAAKKNITVIYVDLDSKLKMKLISMGVAVGLDHHYFNTIDASLEWCENKLLSASQAHFFDFAHEEALPNLISDTENFKLFKTFMNRVFVKQGDYIVRQGEHSNTLYFVKSGLISIIKSSEDHLVRLNKGGAGTVVGEIAFFIQSMRTADVIAEENTELYQLTNDNYLKLQEQYPHIALDFMGNMIKLFASNLKKTNQKIMMLL